MDSKVEQLRSWAKVLIDKFEQGGGTRYIDGAVVLDREALESCPQGHPERLLSLTNLAIDLLHRYRQLGATVDLEEAIVLSGEALNLCPPGHPQRSESLSALAIGLSARYKQFGKMRDLDMAIMLDEEALALRPPGHQERLISLTNLGARLVTRYKQLGETEDLSRAIVLGREAISLCSPGSAEHWMSLDNLAVALATRYQQLGAMEDLDEAIVLGRNVVELCHPEHPSRSMSLNNLSLHLASRYKEFGKMEDLDEAIVLCREALDLRPQGHPLRSSSLNNLALYLSTRYQQLGKIMDLDEAIVHNREAVDLRPQGHPMRPTALINLADCLGSRYMHLIGTEDLDEAVALGQEALDLCPCGHPLWSHSLTRLASQLRMRLIQSRQVEDIEVLFGLYSQLVDAPQMATYSDLAATRDWISVAEHLNHPTMILAYETSLRMLGQYLAALPSLPQHLAVLKGLTISLAVDAFSACLRNHVPIKAVELLERGRGIFWSQLTRLRPPLDDVTASGAAGKMLADEFTHLSTLIRTVLGSPGLNQHEIVCHLNLELQSVVMKIRELPGFSHFLLPSPFSDLQSASKRGPVIIVNASKYGCDALVVLLDRNPVHIPLQVTHEIIQNMSRELHILTKRARREDLTREFAFLLRRLWDQVVSPIVDFLQTMLPSRSRIWWCTTAEFSLLPLHAAGPYRKGQRNLPDIYISSYTPTLSALIHARRPGSSDPASDETRFVAIGQANAIGQTELHSVGTELANVSQLVEGLITFTRIEGPEACVPRVAEVLRKSQWVHLACHGIANRRKPFESAFALHDGLFSIEHIIRCDMENPEFAYLSACHTTVGDETNLDEVVHLASAMQFAGFRSVIGTMWAVDDGETNKITSTFYKYMVDESGHMDHTRASYALNKTMKSINIPLDQRILYIHLGA